MKSDKREPDVVRGAIVRALAIELKVSEDLIRNTKSLRNELAMDSIAAVNVAFVVEDELSIEIEMRESDVFDSVEDLVAIVRRSVDRG